MSHFYEQPTEAYTETSSEKYEIVRPLGKGGTAHILLAQHRHSGLPLVIKVPKQEVPYAVHALRREAAALKRLRHDHLIEMYEYAQWEMSPALMLEYAYYRDVRQYYRVGSKALVLPTVIELTRQAASAMDYMHMNGFVHRDIKPDNMLLLRPQYMVLSDLGLAVPEHVLPSLKQPMGTVRYMAPEQIEGAPCRASDQYALAIVVYELLCTRPPFIGTIDELMYQHCSIQAPRLQGEAAGLPMAIERALHKAMEKDPARRFANGEEFYLALKESKKKVYLHGDRNGSSSTPTSKSLFESSAINTVRQQVPIPAVARPVKYSERHQKQTELPLKRRPSFHYLDLFLFVLAHLIAIILMGGLYNMLLFFFNALLLIALRLNRMSSIVIYSVEVAILLLSFVIGSRGLIAFDSCYLVCLLLLIYLSISLCVAPIHQKKNTT